MKHLGVFSRTLVVKTACGVQDPRAVHYKDWTRSPGRACHICHWAYQAAMVGEEAKRYGCSPKEARASGVRWMQLQLQKMRI